VLALAGTFWYWRNWLELGNPVGLLRVGIGGITLFPGFDTIPPLRQTTLAGVFDPSAMTDWQILYQAIAAQLSLPFALLMMAAAGLALGRDEVSPQRKAVVRGASLLAAVMLLTYVLTPFSGDNGANGYRVSPWIAQGFRFALPFVGVMGVLAALGMEELQSTRKHRALFIGCAAIWALANVSSIETSLAGALIVFAVFALTRSYKWLRTASSGRYATAATRVALVLLLTVLGTGTYWLRARRYERRIALYGPIVAYVDQHTRPTDVIGYLLTHQSYVLHGSDLRGLVIAAPTAVTGSEWIARLRDANVTHVAVGPLLPAWRMSEELKSLNDRSRFELVFGSDWNREPMLFRLK
jgi:hypothetical protein